MLKHILVILDGCADEPQEALGGRTPLQAAQTPHLDAMAAKGRMARVRTVPEGVPPGSDTAILSIFGYDPREYYTGRSPLEAAGCGVLLKPGNISFRANLCTLEGEGPLESRIIRSHNGGNIEGEEALTLMQALLEDSQIQDILAQLRMDITPTPTFRHVAVMAESPGDFSTTPPHDHLGEAAGEHLPRGIEPLAQLMRRSLEALDEHPINQHRRAQGKLPANTLWPWGEGTAVELPSFAQRTDKRAAVISAVPLVQGIGRLCGAQVIQVPGATGELNTDYRAKALAAADALEENDLVVVHVEAPDECSHEGDLAGKIEAIRRIDALLIPVLAERIAKAGWDSRWMALSDHYTLLSTQGHDGTPVPCLLYDSRQDTGEGRSFDEPSAALGPLIDPGHTCIDDFLRKE